MSNLSRRNLLRSTAAASLPVALAGSSSLSSAQEKADFKVEDQQPFRAQTRRLKITNQGRYLTSLIFSTDYPTHFRLKPEFYPVLTPAGFPVTDSHQYCFIHHQSIMCGHGRVRVHDGRVIDFYRKLNFAEEDRSDRWHTPERNLFQLGPSGIQRITQADWEIGEKVSINLKLEWQTREANAESGETILVEQRRYEIAQVGNYTIIDHFTRLIPAKGTAVLEADRHSFCGVRVNDLIDVENGGMMHDSEKRKNPDGNYWDANGDRKAPRWVDCTGRIGDRTVGMTLMGHPANVRNQYYMRDWGLMEVSASLGNDVSFSGGNPFFFATRYVAHDGEMTGESADALFTEFAKISSGSQ